MTATRIEQDQFGSIAVPIQQLWGAYTQRSLQNVDVQGEKQPHEIIHALALVKKACANANAAKGALDPIKAMAIGKAADEILGGQHPNEFPLTVWQTGAVTHANININEVLAHRANAILGIKRDTNRLVHPHKDVDHNQSSDNIYHTAMHVAAVTALESTLLPALSKLRSTLQTKRETLSDIVKLDRSTQSLAGEPENPDWLLQLSHCETQIRESLPHLYELHLDSADVLAPQDFVHAMAHELTQLSGYAFVASTHKFTPIASFDALLRTHGRLKTLATNLMKIASDVRWLTLGGYGSYGHLEPTFSESALHTLPLPCKISPSQSKAMTVLCAQVCGNDVAINFSSASGNFEHHVFRPMVAHNFLQSLRLLSDGIESFNRLCTDSVEPYTGPIEELLQRSVLVAEALSPSVDESIEAPIPPTLPEAMPSDFSIAATVSDYQPAEAFDHHGITKRSGNSFPY